MGECKLGGVTISGGEFLSCLSPKDPPNFLPFAEVSDLAHHHTEGLEDKYFLFSNENPIIVSTNGSGSKTFYAGVGLNTQFQRGVLIDSCRISVDQKPVCDAPLPQGIRVFTSTGYYIEGDLIEACVDECFEAMKKGVGIYYSPEAYRESLWENFRSAKSAKTQRMILSHLRPLSDVELLRRFLKWSEEQKDPDTMNLLLEFIAHSLESMREFGDSAQYQIFLKNFNGLLEKYLKDGREEFYEGIAAALLTLADLSVDSSLIARLVPKVDENIRTRLSQLPGEKDWLKKNPYYQLRENPLHPLDPKRKMISNLKHALQTGGELRNKIGLWLERDNGDLMTEYVGLMVPVKDRFDFKVYAPASWGSDFVGYLPHSIGDNLGTDENFFDHTVHLHTLRDPMATLHLVHDRRNPYHLNEYTRFLIMRKGEGVFSVKFNSLFGMVSLGDYHYSARMPRDR